MIKKIFNLHKKTSHRLAVGMYVCFCSAVEELISRETLSRICEKLYKQKKKRKDLETNSKNISREFTEEDG